jgi:hypothetical protein
MSQILLLPLIRCMVRLPSQVWKRRGSEEERKGERRERGGREEGERGERREREKREGGLRYDEGREGERERGRGKGK